MQCRVGRVFSCFNAELLCLFQHALSLSLSRTVCLCITAVCSFIPARGEKSVMEERHERTHAKRDTREEERERERERERESEMRGRERGRRREERV